MYVSKIAEQLKEYNRLQKLIDNIEQALADLEPLEPKEEGRYATGGIVNCTLTFGENTATTKRATMSSDVVTLMREDLKALLVKHRDILFEEQQWLEVS